MKTDFIDINGLEVFKDEYVDVQLNTKVDSNDSRLSDSRTASDVYAWAKAATKPSYTKNEIGLGNVDNTSDTAKKTSFTGQIAQNNTGFVTGGDVYTALRNSGEPVDAYTKAESDERYQVKGSYQPAGNYATTAELSEKVDKISGKGLSTNDYTNADKSKLADLPTNERLVTTISTMGTILEGKADTSDVNTALAGKADKSEMSITAGTGTNSDKTTIQLKSGTSATVLTQHQDISSKQNVITDLSAIRSGAAAGATAQQPATTLAGYGITDAYTKTQTYSKEEVNNLITTPDVEYVTVEATAQTTDATSLLPVSGDADTIYRVACWDGAQYDSTVYSEYAWNGTAYLKLDTKAGTLDVKDNSVTTAKLANGSVTKDKLAYNDYLVDTSSLNLLNPNDEDVIDNHYINKEDSTAASSNYWISGYIPVEYGRKYYVGDNGTLYSTVARTYEFYDSSKNLIIGSFVDNDSPGMTSLITVPQGAYYIRISVTKEATKPQMNADSIQPYSEYYLRTSIDGKELLDKSVTLKKLSDEVRNEIKSAGGVKDLFGIISGDNLINTNDKDIQDKKYINREGTTNDNPDYFITGYIPVTEGKTYYGGNNGVAAITTLRTFEFYDQSKTLITGSFVDNVNSPVSQFVAPQGAYFVRLSVQKNLSPKPQLNVDSLKPYSVWEEPYTAMDGKAIIKGSVEEDRLSSDVIGKLGRQPFGRFVDTKTLSQGEYLILPVTHIQKNNLLSCDIDGSISSIAIGVGYSSSETYQNRDYAAFWVEIDSTNIKQYRSYNSAPQLINTVQHDITLTSQTKVVLDFGVDNAKVRLFNDLGDVFESTIQAAGVGRPFVYNGGSTSISCSLTDFPRDLTKKVWLFGDSYISFTSNARWPYYFKEYGYTNYLCDSQPGMSPESGVTELNNLLNLGFKPSLLVWTLGMNGNTTESQSGGQYVINSYQKANIDAVVSICEKNGIELVLGVIPTVPERQKTGFGNYVKSLGVRYIDWAKAVGANSSGQWNDGLLSSDNVHPTALGAKVLASQVLVDCPELTTT